MRVSRSGFERARVRVVPLVGLLNGTGLLLDSVLPDKQRSPSNLCWTARKPSASPKNLTTISSMMLAASPIRPRRETGGGRFRATGMITTFSGLWAYGTIRQSFGIERFDLVLNPLRVLGRIFLVSLRR